MQNDQRRMPEPGMAKFLKRQIYRLHDHKTGLFRRLGSSVDVNIGSGLEAVHHGIELTLPK